MYTWTLDVSSSSSRDAENLKVCYRLMTGYPVCLEKGILSGKCNSPSDLEGQAGIEFRITPETLIGINLEGLDEGQKYFLSKYIEEYCKPLKITRHMSESVPEGSSKGRLPDTLIHVSESFCEGYGSGVIGTVIFSPHTHLIGTKVKLDGRSNVPINQYGTPI